MIYFNFIKKTFFLLIFIFLTLLFIEVFLRVLGIMNSRNPTLSQMGKGKEFAIICLGDSFTYGWGVDASLTYPRQLERMLNSADSTRKFKIYNLAVPGSNSSQHLKYLKELIKKYNKPDLVIILTGANDVWNLAESNIYRLPGANRDKDRLIMYKIKLFFADFRIYKMAKILLLNLKGKTPESEVDLFSQLPQQKDVNLEDSSRLVRYNLTEIYLLLKANNIRMIFQNYPTGDPCGEGTVENTAKSLDVPFVNNYANFNTELKRVNPKDLFLYDNSHPTAAGYAIIAEALRKVIVTQILK